MGFQMFWSLLLTAALASPVTLKSTDGLNVFAEANGKGDKAILLVHGDGRSHSDWQFFSQKLNDIGYRTLSIDLRGHGKSAAIESLTEEDYLSMPHDVTAGIDWLHKQGVKSITAIGTELGATAIVAAAANNKAVSSILLLTPHLNSNGLKISTALLEQYGPRPVLMAAGIDDAKSVKAATLMEGKFTGHTTVEIVTDGGSGINMLNRSPTFEGVVISWLHQSENLESGSNGSSEGRLKASDVEEIKTTGTLFSDR
jgi:pimeloyl-ACP methyl ester carboxylesterase